ncbi:autotransporter family protein [Budvicia aquatica]|uniref:autotransporter family protein n=1 Tax=Budvicia aquatica TaxID=82979 RepID=UPI002101C4B4|nr:autotransporter outer membrane beta-barrel domain-containing protein [Budvicia aquatica]
MIQLAGKNIGNTLTVNGDYTGGGTLVINAVLNDDSSATDKLIVTGNTSGETGVIVNNIRGKGQQTVNGIEVVNVGGLSDGTFKLNNRAVAGAYEYFLHKDGVETADGNWYLRSQLPSTVDPVDPVNPTPTDNIIRPEAGSYMANMAAASKMFNLRLEDREGRAENSSMWLRQVGQEPSFVIPPVSHARSPIPMWFKGGAEVWGSHFNDNDRLGIGLMAAYGNASSKTALTAPGIAQKVPLMATVPAFMLPGIRTQPV